MVFRIYDAIFRRIRSELYSDYQSGIDKYDMGASFAVGIKRLQYDTADEFLPYNSCRIGGSGS